MRICRPVRAESSRVCGACWDSTRRHWSRIWSHPRAFIACFAADENTVRRAALSATEASPSADTGLHFICLVANIKRQFEFVQSAWLMGSKFAGLTGESDPLLGHRLPRPGRILPPTASRFRKPMVRIAA